MKPTAKDATAQLLAGNHRFAEAVGTSNANLLHNYLERGLPRTQNPIAIVIGCSDARVPVENVFDQGPGDLFVVRTAGNLVGTLQCGSIEFALAQFAPPLIVVLAHTDCGAIRATLEVGGSVNDLPDNLARVVDCVHHNIAGETDIARAVRTNAFAVAHTLRESSGLVNELVAAGRVSLICAEYAVTSGRVTILDPP